MDKVKRIEELHMKNYNCAQAFLCAYAEDLGIEEEKLFALAEGLGRGIAGLEETCCIPIITSMLISYLETSDHNLHKPSSKLNTYACAKCLAMEFKDKYGTLKCHELLQTNQKKRCCTDLIITGEKILSGCLKEDCDAE